MTATKTCTKCSVEQATSCFYASAKYRDGLTTWCKSCFKEYRTGWNKRNVDRRRKTGMAWEKANPDKVRAKAKKQYEKNRDSLLARSREWREANPEKHKEVYRRWARLNPDKVRAIANNKRAARANAPGTASSKQIELRWQMFGGKCWMCGREAQCTDHVIPIAGGGSNWPSNLRPACTSCNSSKKDKRIPIGR